MSFVRKSFSTSENYITCQRISSSFKKEQTHGDKSVADIGLTARVNAPRSFGNLLVLELQEVLIARGEDLGGISTGFLKWIECAEL